MACSAHFAGIPPSPCQTNPKAAWLRQRWLVGGRGGRTRGPNRVMMVVLGVVEKSEEDDEGWMVMACIITLKNCERIASLAFCYV